ncbi:hypothetical protein VFPPC_17855 [Pochonia chlamydosporia 170]|uniref:Uncharacterized protein n=1 Tax=Pochonia chlamydosporia 170 TaxID=1380566 RepID=A0A219AQR6_METCM|nr:hypothetical protein VFPPC_17855 [Pochonia chlamydosporia 170]OWT42952.1 hypothetical protein VFPPC_17855 [Pochonia chlamydosporia 170]
MAIPGLCIKTTSLSSPASIITLCNIKRKEGGVRAISSAVTQPEQGMLNKTMRLPATASRPVRCPMLHIHLQGLCFCLPHIALQLDSRLPGVGLLPAATSLRIPRGQVLKPHSGPSIARRTANYHRLVRAVPFENREKQHYIPTF